jgi:hypothetical protein
MKEKILLFESDRFYPANEWNLYLFSTEALNNHYLPVSCKTLIFFMV